MKAQLLFTIKVTNTRAQTTSNRLLQTNCIKKIVITKIINLKINYNKIIDQVIDLTSLVRFELKC